MQNNTNQQQSGGMGGAPPGGGGGGGGGGGSGASGGGAGGGPQMTAQQYQARLMQQQQLQAIQAAARQQQQQQTASPAQQPQQQQQRPPPPPQQQQQQQQQPQNLAMGNATQGQMQALQQLFQNNPEQLAQFINLTKEGKMSPEQMNQLRSVMAAAQRSQQAQQQIPQQQPAQAQHLQNPQQQQPPVRPHIQPQPAQQSPVPQPQQPPPQSGPPQQQNQITQPQAQQPQPQPQPQRPAGQLGAGQDRPNVQVIMQRIQQLAEPVVRRIKEIEAALSAKPDEQQATPDRLKMHHDLAQLKAQQRKLGEQFMLARAQHLAQQGHKKESEQLVNQVKQQQQQRAAAAAAAAATQSGQQQAPQAAAGPQGQGPTQMPAQAPAQAQARVPSHPGSVPLAASSPASTQAAPTTVAQAVSAAQPAAGAGAASSPQGSAPPDGTRRGSITEKTVPEAPQIPEQLNIAPSGPEPYPNAAGPRPTLSHGLGTNPVLGTPALLERPEPMQGAIAGAAAGVAGSGSGSSNWEELLGVPARETKSGSAPAASNAAEKSGASAEEVANEMGNTDYWESLTGRGTGAESLLSAGSTSASAAPGAAAATGAGDGRLLSKRKVQELVGEIDANERLEGDVEDLLLEVADEFIDSVSEFACRLAKHRKGDRLEVRDVQVVLERNWNLRIPTPGSVPIPPPRIKAAQTGTAGGAASKNNTSAQSA